MRKQQAKPQNTTAALAEKAGAPVMTPAEARKVDESEPAAFQYNPESLQMAYDLTVKSYDLAERRLDVVEKRLQDTLAFGVTATLAAITILAGKKAHYDALPFRAACLFFAIAIVVGLFTRLHGSLEMLQPSDLYKQYLGINSIDFRSKLVYWGGEAFTLNQRMILKKSRLTVLCTICFLLEFILLVWWAA